MELEFSGSIWGEARFEWSYLARRFQVPEALPIPLPTGTVDARIGLDLSMEALSLRVDATYRLPYPPRLLGLEIGRDVEIWFRSRALDSAELPEVREGWDSGAVKLEGSMGGRLRLRLPPAPDLPFVLIETGDAEGWITVEFETILSTDADPDPAGDAAGATLGLRVLDVGTVSLQFPGLPQPQPPLVVELGEISGTLAQVAGDWQAKLAAEGSFRFAPVLPIRDVPILTYLETLIGGQSMEGTVRCELELNRENPLLRIKGTSPDADASIDVVQILTELTRGTASPETLDALARVDCSGLTELGFGLKSLEAVIAREPVFQIGLEARIGTARIPAHFLLSNRELSIGLGPADHPLLTPDPANVIEIPFRVPHLTRQKLGYPEGAEAARSAPADRRAPDHAIWANVSRERQDSYNEKVDALVLAVEALTGAISGGSGPVIAALEPDRWRVRPRDPADPPPRSDFQVVNAAVEVDGRITKDMALVCQIRGEWHVLIARPRLRLDSLFVTLDFQNPRQIRLGAEASLVFDGPDAREHGISLVGELAADTIYFTLKQADAHPIAFGDIELRVARLLFGFGYTRRSLAMAFAGELKLPSEVLDALDTSDELGVGIRVPGKSKVDIKFELIPVTLGKVVVPIPMLQFDFDLREGSSPPLRDARNCLPYWDGLQFIAHGVMRLALKRISYSPILTLFAASNSDFDADIDLGDERTGVTVIADNVFWAYGIDSGCALMLAPITALPFADNFCVSVRIGGFRVNFNLQRPIPTFSPFAIFELLALISDPAGYEVAPRGELADSIRLSLTDAYVILPEAAKRLFPGADSVMHQPLEVTINLGTYIRLLQGMGKAIAPAVAAATNAWDNREALAGELARTAADLQSGGIRTIVSEIVHALPPELRKVRLDASFAGFEGKAAILLADRDTVIDAFSGSSGSAEPGDALTDLTGEAWDPDSLDRFRPNLRATRDGGRLFDPTDPRENPLRGSEFDEFGLDDIEAIGFPASGALFSVGDIQPPLARGLSSPQGSHTPPESRLILRALRERLSDRARDELDGYDGLLIGDNLQGMLVRELNDLLRGDSIYTDERFAGIALDPLVVELEATASSRDDRIRLNRLLIEAAVAGGVRKATGVLIGARLRLLPGQRFRFIGYLFDDGSFSLVTSSQVDLLRLWVAGLSKSFDLEIRNRITLTGRARRDGVSGRVRAEGSLYWKSEDEVVEILLEGAHDKKGWKPVVLEMTSDGRFRLAGRASIKLFNGAIGGSGDFEVTETYCLAENVSAGFNIDDVLAADFNHGRARIGPGPDFELSGTGTLSLFGMTAPSASVRIFPGGAAVQAAARFGEWPGLGFLPGPGFSLDAALAGSVTIGDGSPVPSVNLSGAGTLELERYGVAVDGQAQVGFDESGLRMRLSGRLTVRDRDWLDGYVEFRRDSWSMGGHIAFDLPITPSGESGIIDVAMLTLSGSLSCEMRFGPAGLREWSLRGECGVAFKPAQGSPFLLGTVRIPLAGTPSGFIDANQPIRIFPAGEFNLFPEPPPTIQSSGVVKLDPGSIIDDLNIFSDTDPISLQRGYDIIAGEMPKEPLMEISLRWDGERIRVRRGGMDLVQL